MKTAQRNLWDSRMAVHPQVLPSWPRCCATCLPTDLIGGGPVFIEHRCMLHLNVAQCWDIQILRHQFLQHQGDIQDPHIRERILKNRKQRGSGHHKHIYECGFYHVFLHQAARPRYPAGVGQNPAQNQKRKKQALKITSKIPIAIPKWELTSGDIDKYTSGTNKNRNWTASKYKQPKSRKWWSIGNENTR